MICNYGQISWCLVGYKERYRRQMHAWLDMHGHLRANRSHPLQHTSSKEAKHLDGDSHPTAIMPASLPGAPLLPAAHPSTRCIPSAPHTSSGVRWAAPSICSSPGLHSTLRAHLEGWDGAPGLEGLPHKSQPCRQHGTDLLNILPTTLLNVPLWWGEGLGALQAPPAYR